MLLVAGIIAIIIVAVSVIGYKMFKKKPYPATITDLRCAPGSELTGSFCGPLPEPGYECDGQMCRQVCPDGYKTDGIYCKVPMYGATVSTNAECEPGMDLEANYCYEPPRDGFECSGMYCAKPCPEGYTFQYGACWNPNKPTMVSREGYTRTGNLAAICPSGTISLAGKCFEPCESGYTFNSGYCYGGCPDGFNASFGDNCRRPFYTRELANPECPPGTQKYVNMCVEPCKDGYYFNLSDHKCTPNGQRTAQPGRNQIMQLSTR